MKNSTSQTARALQVQPGLNLEPVFCVKAFLMPDADGHHGDWQETLCRNGELSGMFKNNLADHFRVFPSTDKALAAIPACPGYRHYVKHCGWKDKSSWRGFRPGEKEILIPV